MTEPQEVPPETTQTRQRASPGWLGQFGLCPQAPAAAAPGAERWTALGAKWDTWVRPGPWPLGGAAPAAAAAGLSPLRTWPR